MNQTRLSAFAVLLLIISLMMAACTPAATPTANPGQGETEATVVPEAEATESSGETGTDTGTTDVSGAVTLWHAYGTGGAEEAALGTLIDNAKAAFPNLEISVVQLPFDQIFNRYQTEVGGGQGPDMFVAPNDDLGNLSRAGLVAPLDEMLEGRLDGVNDVAVEGMRVDGVLYGVPESAKAVALYYNSEMVPEPPTTMEDLLELVESGQNIVLNQSAYHSYPFFTAFGGELLSDDGACTADAGGFAEGLAFMEQLRDAGAIFEVDGGRADTLFRTGEVAMIINGPWALVDYTTDLGENVGVVPVPDGTQPAAALNGIDGFYINPNSQNMEGAVELALYLSGPESAAIYTEEAGHVPIRSDVTASDPLVAAFAEASAQGFPRPQTTQFGNWWTPFGDAITKVMENVSEPEAAIAEACTAMNAASGQ